MKDVINVLNALLKDLESTDSLEGLIHSVRDLINLIDSHEYLKTSIDELSKTKIQDQKHFENIAAAVVKDVHRAALELKKKIDCSSRLKTGINTSFFAEIKSKVKLTEYPIEERPLLLIDPLLKLLNAILDCGGTEYLIAPYASIASNNDRKFIREITFSDNIRTFCREAEHFRARREMALWNMWERISLFHEWTKDGITNSVSRDKLEIFSIKNQIRYAFKTICRHLLSNSSEVKTSEMSTLIPSSLVKGNLNKLSQLKSETFIVLALELFIEPFECQIWILSHHNNGEYTPHFVAWCKDGSNPHQFAMHLRCLNKGAILNDADLPRKRNDLGIKGILKDIFFLNSKIFNGSYVKISELPFKISNEQLLAALPTTKQRTPRFPVEAYRAHGKNPS
jgi:hypothetical protein